MAKLNMKITDANKFFVFNAMDDWVRILDKNGKVVFVNNKMKEDVNNKENLGFDSLRDLTIGDQFNILKTTTVEEEKFIDGKFYSVKSSPIYFNEEFVGIIEVYRDITGESKMKMDLFNANRKMLDDIRFVRKIQSSILPKNKRYGQIKLQGRYIPCNNLSGDLFDIVPINYYKYAFYIADVMGHGVKSSIMTMFVKLSLNAIFDKYQDYSPSQILKKLREKFVGLKINSSQYFTIWLGIFNLKDDSLTFSNAGHNSSPIHLNVETNKTDILEISGRMISNIIEASDYKEKKIKLNFNDKILFYTDGVVESKGIEKDEYGIRRLEEKFKKEKNVDSILEDLSNFRWGEQSDDITLALIEYKEKNDED